MSIGIPSTWGGVRHRLENDRDVGVQHCRRVCWRGTGSVWPRLRRLRVGSGGKGGSPPRPACWTDRPGHLLCLFYGCGSSCSVYRVIGVWQQDSQRPQRENGVTVHASGPIPHAPSLWGIAGTARCPLCSSPFFCVFFGFFWGGLEFVRRLYRATVLRCYSCGNMSRSARFLQVGSDT